MTDTSTPLTAEQVFQIADPAITLNTLETMAVPTMKVDLQARLAVELNRQIMSSNATAKKRLRKQLKRLLNDRMSAKEEKKMLSTMYDTGLKVDYKTTRGDFVSKKDTAVAKLKKVRADKKVYTEAYNVKVVAYNDYLDAKEKNDDGKRLTTAEKNILKKIKYDPESRKSIREFKEFEDSITKLRTKVKDTSDNIEGVDKQQNDLAKIPITDIPAIKSKIETIDQSILETDHRQQEIEDEEKIAMNERINPAAFQKTLNERIAESNTLFQGLINAGQSEPHITVPFERIGDFNDINELFVERSTGRITNMILIIYRSSELYGHWCALTRSNNLKRLTYFNSYGSYIDKAMDHIPQEFADMTKQNFPYLLKLLHDSDYEIHWNDNQLQVMDNKTATCGHWCGLWMRSNKLGKTLEEFSLPFLSIPLNEKDEIAARLAAPYLISS